MIHYHGTPIGGGLHPAQALAGRHCLVSYANQEQLHQAAEICSSFVLDNGAFTTWKQGKPFDLDGYMEWSAKWLKHPACDWAIAPDVIDGGEIENDALLNLVSHKPHQYVPVWHMDESLRRLAGLCYEWPRVAIGSAGEYATIGSSKWWQRMAEAMNAATDRNGVPLAKLHGLRMLDPGIVRRFPFSSCDSTNAGVNCGSLRWAGPYEPASKKVKALVIMDRIESQQSPCVWHRQPEQNGLWD